jgi:hypothetical protein
MSYAKAKIFAAENGEHVFWWRYKQEKWWNRPLLVEERLQMIESDPCFWQYFVAGADAFLTSNVNTNLGLANGTQVQLHSLTLSSEEQICEVEAQIKRSLPGSIITLDVAPISVNMKLDTNLDSTSKRRAQKLVLSRISMEEDYIVIPIRKDDKVNSHTFGLRQAFFWYW